MRKLYQILIVSIFLAASVGCQTTRDQGVFPLHLMMRELPTQC